MAFFDRRLASNYIFIRRYREGLRLLLKEEERSGPLIGTIVELVVGNLAGRGVKGITFVG